MPKPDSASYRDHFPRLLELRGSLPDPHPVRAALPAMDETLMQPGKRHYYEPIEAALQALDAPGWAEFKARMTPWPKSHPKRGLEPLLNALNEARAFKFLLDMGFSNVHFIPASKMRRQRTPDLGAEDHGRQVLCDAKTVNRSDEEVHRFRSGGVGTTTAQLPPEFFDKIRRTCEDAKKQMTSHDPSGLARKIVYIFVNFDDHEPSASYRCELDQFRLSNPIAGLEIYFESQPPWGG